MLLYTDNIIIVTHYSMNTVSPQPTSIFPVENIRNDYGIKSVFVKDESRNPTGTIKDRRSFEIVEKALRLGVDKVVLMTCGNSGISLAHFARGTRLKIVCCVDRNVSAYIKTALREVCYQVIELNLEHRIIRPEELISFARERDDEVIWDVTYGFEDSYVPIINEILHRVKPDYIVVPIGSGGIFIGLIQGLQKFNVQTKVIGIGVQNTIQSSADKLCTPWSPYTRIMQSHCESRQTRSRDLPEHSAGHFMYNLTEDEIKKTYQTFKNSARCDASSAVVFAALNKHPFRPKDTVVFLNSGRSTI